MTVISNIDESSSAAGQLKGVWKLVSIEYVQRNGERTPGFGLDPIGVAFFEPNNFVISVMRSDRRKYEISDRLSGTADENRETASGTVTYFGTYYLDELEKVIAIHIVGSSFPNWNDTHQRRSYLLDGDRLRLISPGSQAGDGWSEVTWAKANKSGASADE